MVNLLRKIGADQPSSLVGVPLQGKSDTYHPRQKPNTDRTLLAAATDVEQRALIELSHINPLLILYARNSLGRA